MPDARSSIDPVAGVILAGGRSQRLGGGDKGLLELGGRPLLAHAIDRLRGQVAALVLNANGDPARFARFGLPVIPDGLPDWPGPLAGVLAGLDWAAERGFPAIVTAAADTPDFPPDLVAGLRAAAGTSGTELAIAASPDAEGALQPHPTFGLWPVALRGRLRAELGAGQRRVRAFAEAQGCTFAAFPGADRFFNINTQADLAAARARWR